MLAMAGRLSCAEPEEGLAGGSQGPGGRNTGEPGDGQWTLFDSAAIERPHGLRLRERVTESDAAELDDLRDRTQDAPLDDRTRDAPLDDRARDAPLGRSLSQVERTLDGLIAEAWGRLLSHARVGCPACGETMEPAYGAHALPIGGCCSSCGSRLS
jgi:hypothetical protein